MAPDAVFEFIIACPFGKQGGHDALYRKPASGRPIDDPLAYLVLVKGHAWTLTAKSRQGLLADYPKKSPAEAGPENRVSQLGARVVGWRDGQNEARSVSAARASRIQFGCCSSALGDSAALAPYTLGMSTRVLKSPVAIRGSSFMLRHDSCLTIVSDGRASPAPWPWPASVYTTGPTAAAVHQMDY